MSQYLDSRFETLAPYVPGEQPKGRSFIKLNTNESPYPPSPKAQQAACGEAVGLNLYPDPTSGILIDALAKTFSVAPENVFAGNGSDEILAFCFQALCPGGAAFADITYGFYPVYAALYGTDAKIIPLREDFSLAPEDYYGLGRTLFIANPNAPTGLALTRAQIEDILRQNSGSLVIVDEAYVDFGAESAVPLIDSYDNLMVVGTFSKSRAMAGARLGYAVADAALIADLNRIKFSFNPYNLNRMTMAAGAASVLDTAYFEECRGKVMTTRTRSLAALREMGFACTDSLANFMFASHPDIPAEALYGALREKGILVRWFNAPRIKNHLRITVGSDEQMDALHEALREILKESGK